MNCTQCNTGFQIEEQEQRFLQSMDLPPPRLCPMCRRQRRLAFRNERRMHYRTCDATGEKILALYPQETQETEGQIQAIEQQVWWDDKKWDPMKFGQDFDFSRPFFEQFAELKKKVPRPALHNTMVENAMYGNHCVSNKNCYMNIGSDLCEGCYFTYWAIRCRDCFDISIAYDSELCYDSTDIRNCFNCQHTDNSESMIDCQYCEDCKSCQECFGCVGLRHKRYHFLNENLPVDEYRNRVEYLRDHPEALKAFMTLYEQLRHHAVMCATKNIQSEDVMGDRLFRCRTSHESFDLEKCEELDHCTFGFDGMTSQDIDFFGQAERMYEGFSAFGQYNCIATIMCHYSHDVHYSEYCVSSNNLFGCISLHRKQHCIFNKQYRREEYEDLKEKIIEHMKKTGEWGEFFPIELSPFPYNVTVAQDHYPLSRAEIEERGWKYEKVDESASDYEGPFAKIPENITETDKNNVCDKVYECEISKRPYKIMPVEYQYLKDRKLPLPHYHQDERNKLRMARRNGQTFWDRPCGHCGQKVATSYDPEKGRKIYCRSCYEANILSTSDSAESQESKKVESLTETPL